MAVIKCKMCGGDLDISEGLSVCECEYCGSRQTVPTADNEKKMTLFSRANRLRLANEFDKASGVYESIVAEFPEEAEAYWGLVLCRYGIEYVDDPATGKKIPTCHRVSFDSVLEDTDFEQACENADALARRQYREEAKRFEDIRRGIIEVSGREEPYDIFICYKETDENGERTIDSVIAQDVYDALIGKGYRVFFSRISLEDKLGTEYEPYIFAALNSAKIMLAFGTDYEFYNAVWVKNEWSRFLKLMEKDKSKHLIPCYKNLDPYDMPKEFQRLQGQDMGKVGAVQDLLRGIEKILPRNGTEQAEASAQPAVQQIIQGGGPNVTALLQRGNMALEDGEWNKAREYFDQVLNMDAQCADAYLGLAMTDFNLHSLEELTSQTFIQKLNTWKGNASYIKYLRFASEQKKQHVLNIVRKIEEEIKERECNLSVIRQHFDSVKGMISTNDQYTVGLRSDGRVVTTEKKDRRYYVAEWSEIKSVSASSTHTVGLKSNGTVVAAGQNWEGQCNVSSWHDIIAVCVTSYRTFGLKSDGTVVFTGGIDSTMSHVSDWHDIIKITGNSYYVVGLKADGKVVVTGDEKHIPSDLKNWENIVSIESNGILTVGLRSDGTVVHTSRLISTSDWLNIIEIATGEGHIVGLRSDGTVVASGQNDKRQCDVNNWRDIVAVCAGDFHTIGLRSDGTVVTTGDNKNGQCLVWDWKLFQSIDTIEQERQEAAERAEKKRQEAAEREEKAQQEMLLRAEQEKIKAEVERNQRFTELNKEQAALQKELSSLKGLFSNKRRTEILKRLKEIELSLSRLK